MHGRIVKKGLSRNKCGPAKLTHQQVIYCCEYLLMDFGEAVLNSRDRQVHSFGAWRSNLAEDLDVLSLCHPLRRTSLENGTPWYGPYYTRREFGSYPSPSALTLEDNSSLSNLWWSGLVIRSL